MRIAIDIREACRSQPTGKGMWVHGLLPHLLSSEHSFILFTDRAVREDWKRPNTEIIIFPSSWKWHWNTTKYVRKDRPDYYLSPTSFIVPYLLRTSVPCLLVIHDLIAFRWGKHSWKARILEFGFLKRASKSAAHIFAISESTKRDFLAKFRRVNIHKVSVVYAGPHTEEPTLNHPDGKTILCIGTLCPRKNQLRLIQAYARLPENLRANYQLILVGGRGWSDQKTIDLARKTEGVDWRGYVSGDAYDKFLSTCTVFAYPSLYEGFGLPVLDALQRGVPVLTSGRGSLPEVTGDAAVLVEPRSIHSITEGLEKILSNEKLREELKEKGLRQAQKFSWEKTADRILQTIS